jgi:endonuclease I
MIDFLRRPAHALSACFVSVFVVFATHACSSGSDPVVDAGLESVDAASTDAGISSSDAGAPLDAGRADAGAPDAAVQPTFPDWPPVFLSSFAVSYDGPIADGEDVWIELRVANAEALAALGGWRLGSASYWETSIQLDSSDLSFALVDGDRIRVHGYDYTGRTDRVRSDNNPDVWDVVSTEPYGPSLKHGLLWLEDADGRVLDAVVYVTDRNQGDWFEDDALDAIWRIVAAGEWPSVEPEDAIALGDADRNWARVAPALQRAGDDATDWQVVGETLGTYYERARGKTGEALKKALNAIVRNHVAISYSEVSSAFFQTDVDPEDPERVIQFYTGRSTRSDFNKEHVWAKSHGGFGSDHYDGYSDLHNLRPTRPDVNSRRWHLDFAEGGELYSDTDCRFVPGYSFEPPDRVKGDVARTLFYMAVRYEGGDGMPDLELVEEIPSLLDSQGIPNNNQHKSTPRFGKLSTLLDWHVLDPPDDQERRRNEVIFREFQRNRNPFVDHPEWVSEIWGGPAWPHPVP